MFDLEQAVADWRAQMLAAGVQTPVPLEELESHLREEIEQQIKAGHSMETAFTSAVQTIGAAQTVQKEFKKIRTHKRDLNWKFFTVLFLSYTALYPLLVGSLAFIFKNGAFSEMTSKQQILSLASAVVFSLVTWGMQWTCGKFPPLRVSRTRDIILAPVMLWLVMFAYLIMPQVGLTGSQQAVVSLWGLTPFGIVLGWVWGFANGAQKETTKTSACDPRAYV